MAKNSIETAKTIGTGVGLQKGVMAREESKKREAADCVAQHVAN